MVKRSEQSKKSDISNDKDPKINDWHLWSKVTATVSPLKQEKSQKDFRQNQNMIVSSKPISINAKHKKIERKYYAPPYFPNAQKQQLNKNIEPNLLKRLSRGHVKIDGTLDLHGMRQDEAHIELNRFIASRLERGEKTLLVITGKGLNKAGSGILRSMLPLWLSSMPLSAMISGWQIATRKHGGEGAFYVRLKGRQK